MTNALAAPIPGPRILTRLTNAGVKAQSVTRNRRTGIYTIRFGSPNVTNFNSIGTDKGSVWARRIEHVLPEAVIVDTYDSIADWRPGCPVLFATVFIRLDERPELRSEESANDVGTWMEPENANAPVVGAL